MSAMLARKAVIVLGMDEIGAGIARRLSREGARLALLDEDASKAEEVATRLADTGAEAFALAVEHRAIASAIELAATRLGGAHALINNVLPIPALASLDEQSPEMFAAAFVRVQSAACAMQTAVRFMRAAGEGRIVNIGHRYGECVNEGLAAYNAAAWSLVGITRSAAMEWGRDQIATNLLLPLADVTELRQARAQRPQLIDQMIAQLPLRRAGDCVDDIGGAALFLVSDAARFINGMVVHADGGQHVAGPVLNPFKLASSSRVTPGAPRSSG